MKVDKYAFNLEITNNETHEDIENSFSTNDMDVIIKELEEIVKDLVLLKKTGFLLRRKLNDRSRL